MAGSEDATTIGVVNTTIIVVDTNILSASPRLRSQPWQRLREWASGWDVQVVVPEIVAMETVNVVVRDWRVQAQKLEALKLDQLGLTDAAGVMVEEIRRQCVEYDQELRALLSDLGARIAPVPASIDHLEIARRSSERRAPYVDNRSDTEKKSSAVSLKDGYRDTLIWFTLLATAADNPNAEVWFVSANRHDFGGPLKGRDNPEGPTLETFPFPWHRQLAGELSEVGLMDRVQYVLGLDRLVQHLASGHAPVPVEQFAQRLERCEASTVISEQLRDRLLGGRIDPESGGLPLTTVRSQIVDVGHPAEGWQFNDVSGARAGGPWTARFRVDVPVVISVAGARDEPTDVSKPIRISGGVTVGEDGSVTDLVVDGVEALPDDVGRAAWERVPRDYTDKAWLFPFSEDALKVIDQMLRGAVSPEESIGQMADGFQTPPALMDAITREMGDMKPPQNFRDLALFVKQPEVQEAMERAWKAWNATRPTRGTEDGADTDIEG